MSQQAIEKSFTLIDQAVELLQNSLNISFLDSYIENGENIVDDYQIRVMNNQPDSSTVEKLKEIYTELATLELTAEEKRKVSQLVLLKGGQKDQLQPNHQLTPDALGFLFTYLVEELSRDEKKSLTVADLAVGSGNLLATVVLNLAAAGYQVSGLGVDIDDTLLAVAAVNEQWMDAPLKLYHQDSLQHLLVDPVAITIADLPVGYYPNDEQAKEFLVAASEGHTYAHHLLMEQSMRYTKEDGYGLFLVPENFLETEQTENLTNWLTKKVYLQAVLKLPESLFKNESSRKSLILIQNQGPKSQQAKEVLVAALPTLKDVGALQKFFTQFSTWKLANLNK